MKRASELAVDSDQSEKVPKTFVFHVGKVGSTVKKLLDDVREVMEPNTASHLKARRSNTMKDFVNVAGNLGVSHFVVFSQTERTLSLRIARFPHGPTVQFRVTSYSLSNDVRNLAAKRYGHAKDFATSPLVVLNNFGSGEREWALAARSLQTMFPAINIHRIHLADCRRVVLFDRIPGTNRVSFRHYRVKVRRSGVSRPLRRLQKGHVPSLHAAHDVEAMLNRENFGQSESEGDEDARIELRGEESKGAVRLFELGPRMELELTKGRF